MKLLLFDIDGTLLLSGGAGLRAMDQAFDQLYGIPNAFAGINLAGRTDTAILKNVLEKNKLDFNKSAMENFKRIYYDRLQEEIHAPVDGKLLMPGIDALLKSIHKQKDIYLGLLTGNWQTSGFIKLAYFAIDHYFALCHPAI